jgi:hypothetical protein
MIKAEKYQVYKRPCPENATAQPETQAGTCFISATGDLAANRGRFAKTHGLFQVQP